MDFTLRDAAIAGFSEAVVVVRPEIAAEVRHHVERRRVLPVRYVEQPTPRGTADALACAAGALELPFAIVNADDYYGLEPLTDLRAALDRASFGSDQVLAVLYPAGETLPATGFVARARATILADGRVRSFEETTLGWDGTSVVTEAGEEVARDAPVSMNLWGFHPGVRDALTRWVTEPPPSRTDEYRLCDFVDAGVSAAWFRVDALAATGGWFGVTRATDLDDARAAARTLTPVPTR